MRFGRRHLFENAEALQIQDKQARERKKEADALEREKRTLGFLEQ